MSNKKINKKVIICVGIPASGKSTWAKEFVRKNSNYIRINRDDFRFMLKDQPVCEWKIEEMITELQNDTIIKSLSKGFNVIVDNTNLKTKYINQLISLVETHADIEYMVFDVPAKTCIERDKQRDKQVGENVIIKMEKDYKMLIGSFVFQPQKKKEYSENFITPNFKSDKIDAVIFDMDNTLSQMGRRGPFDWHKVDVDNPNEIVIEQTKYHRSLNRKIIITSGRDEICREMTSDWLKFYGVEFDELYMRPANDFRKDTIIKKEIYNNYIKDKYNVLCVYDDRLQVLKTWFELGIFTFNVNQGNKEF